MKYELNKRGRYVPIVYCGNCHKKMMVDDIDGSGKSAIYYLTCDDHCRSWCYIQFDKVIDYGISTD